MPNKALLAFLLVLSAPCYAGQIGIIIGTESGSLRRVIVPDNDAQLHQQNWAGPGETMIVADQAVEITAEIKKFTGKPVTVPLAAVVDKSGLVVSTVVADVALDTVAEGKLVQAFPGVKAGQTFDAARRVFVAPATEITETVMVGDQEITETTLVPKQDMVPVPLDLQPPLHLAPAK